MSIEQTSNTIPVHAAEVAPKTATEAQLNMLKQQFSAGAEYASNTLNGEFVKPSIMGNIVGTGVAALSLLGAGVLMYAGMKSIVTGKKPFGKNESLIA